VPKVDGAPIQSPYVQTFQDNFGKVVRLTVTFDNTTRALSGASVFRDAGCQWTHIYIGRGADGTPNTTTKAFTVPTGTTNLSSGQLGQRGLDVIEDILSLQITAGP
jgi:hypothetical protein